MREAYIGIDRISESESSPVRVGDVSAILKRMDAAFRDGPAQLGYRSMVIADAWSFLNLMKLRKNGDGAAAVRVQLDGPEPLAAGRGAGRKRWKCTAAGARSKRAH